MILFHSFVDKMTCPHDFLRNKKISVAWPSYSSLYNTINDTILNTFYSISWGEPDVHDKQFNEQACAAISAAINHYDEQITTVTCYWSPHDPVHELKTLRHSLCTHMHTVKACIECCIYMTHTIASKISTVYSLWEKPTKRKMRKKWSGNATLRDGRY